MYPLPLEHSKSCRRSYCLEGSLAEFHWNGHHFIDTLFIPFHQLYRSKLFRLPTKHLIIKREGRDYPLGSILAHTFNCLKDKLLYLIATDGILPESIITSHKILRRRTYHSYRSNKVGSNGLIELIQISQS